MFDPIVPRVSANVVAEQQLRESILAGRLAPGDRLPAERDLAAQLGISRLTLRSALATLAAQGLLQVRQGSGYLVRDVRETGGSDLLPAIVARASRALALPTSRRTQPSHEIADLLRLRRYVAAAVLDALVERPPSKSAQAQVRAAVTAFAAVPFEQPDLVAQADIVIVRALLAAAGSLVLQVCLNPIVSVVQGDAALRRALYCDPASNVAAWQAVTAWLVAPKAAAIPLLLTLLARHDTATLQQLVVASRRKATS